MDELFRKEVKVSGRSSWLGTISLAKPLKAWIFPGVAVAISTVVVLFLIFGHYTRRTTVSGSLVPDGGVSVVRAPLSGFVSRVTVSEGSAVKSGDGIALVVSPRAVVEGQDLVAQLKDASARRVDAVEALHVSRETELSERVQSLRHELAKTDAEIESLKLEVQNRSEQTILGRKAASQYRIAAEMKLISGVQHTLQEQAALELENLTRAAKRQLSAMERERIRLSRELASAEAAQEELKATTSSEVNGLRSELLQLVGEREALLKAPMSGTVSSLEIEQNQTVAVGQPMLSIVPEGATLEAHFYVASEHAGFIKEGDRVALRYGPFPYQKFGTFPGRVLRVSYSSVAPSELTGVSSSSTFRVVVGIHDQHVRAYGIDRELRAGMSVQADILGDSRPIYQWVFEPLYSLRSL